MKRRGWLALTASVCLVAASGCASTLVAMTFFQPGRQIGPAALPTGTTEHRVITQDGNAVQLFYAASPGADRCVVYLHGTGGYAATRLPFASALSEAARCDVVVAEFRGYGASPGEPSEAGVYTDARAACRFARETLGHAPERTVIMGRSLGTGIACEVIGDGDYAGVVLMTPFAAGRDLAGHFGVGALSWMLGNPFDSATKLQRFHQPVLIIHGTADHVVPFEQGERLFELANEPKTLLRVEGAPHNLLFEDAAAGYALLAQFVMRCTPSSPVPNAR